MEDQVVTYSVIQCYTYIHISYINTMGSNQNKNLVKLGTLSQPPGTLKLGRMGKVIKMFIALVHVSGCIYVIFKVGTQMRMNRHPPILLGQCPKFERIFFLTASLTLFIDFHNHMCASYEWVSRLNPKHATSHPQTCLRHCLCWFDFASV
jgi:hypothetical protein